MPYSDPSPSDIAHAAEVRAIAGGIFRLIELILLIAILFKVA
jgi:hypothetical protein